jgi:hypothetical protein
MSKKIEEKMNDTYNMFEVLIIVGGPCHVLVLGSAKIKKICN